MKTKAFYLLVLFLITFFSCESQSNYQDNSMVSSVDQWYFHDLTSASSNEAVAQLPLPDGWQVAGPRRNDQFFNPQQHPQFHNFKEVKKQD